jgi:cytochrome c oxidase assembly protein subunit 15
MDFAAGFNLFQAVGPNYLGGTMTNEARVAIHFSHRVGAVVTLLVIGALAYRLLRDPFRGLRRIGLAIACVLTVQFCLGLGNILFQFPVAVATAHNAVGALLLLSMVTLNYQVLTARTAARVPEAAQNKGPGPLVSPALGRG